MGFSETEKQVNLKEMTANTASVWFRRVLLYFLGNFVLAFWVAVAGVPL